MNSCTRILQPFILAIRRQSECFISSLMQADTMARAIRYLWLFLWSCVGITIASFHKNDRQHLIEFLLSFHEKFQQWTNNETRKRKKNTHTQETREKNFNRTNFAWKIEEKKFTSHNKTEKSYLLWEQVLFNDLWKYWIGSDRTQSEEENEFDFNGKWQIALNPFTVSLKPVKLLFCKTFFDFLIAGYRNKWKSRLKIDKTKISWLEPTAEV